MRMTTRPTVSVVVREDPVVAIIASLAETATTVLASIAGPLPGLQIPNLNLE
jgi:hypothetical protein